MVPPRLPNQPKCDRLDRHRLVLMEALPVINVRIDEFFGIAQSGVDPAFSRYLPAVYDAEGTPWRTWAEPLPESHWWRRAHGARFIPRAICGSWSVRMTAPRHGIGSRARGSRCRSARTRTSMARAT